MLLLRTLPVYDTLFFVEVGQRKHELFSVARLMPYSKQTLLPLLDMEKM